MDDEELYQVVFSGRLTDEYDLTTTKRRFAKAFRLDAEKTDRLFSGKARAIKSNVSDQTATDFAIKLMEIGCECYVELMPPSSEQPGLDEQRKAVRRRYNRRGSRPGAVVRRRLPSRRGLDMIQDAKGLDFPGSSVEE